MGFTYKSTQINSLRDVYKVEKKQDEYIVALAGNPNTGKSTVFNALTGLHQHTGNWPGKTVVNARGEFSFKNTDCILVDLPGTYSLFATSSEEEIARDFICFGEPDVTVVVADATCLERNLNLVYQVMELTDKVILCVNLIDEAKKKNILIDSKRLQEELGIPIVMTAARSGIGMQELKDAIFKVITGKMLPTPNKVIYKDSIEEVVYKLKYIVKEKIPKINSRWLSLRLIDGDNKIIKCILKDLDEKERENTLDIVRSLTKNISKEDIRDYITQEIYKKVENVTHTCVNIDENKFNRDRKIDKYITSRIFGIPIMLAILALLFWITLTGANYPSEFLSTTFFKFEDKLTNWFTMINAPKWLYGVLVLGLYRTLAWVISVMLPPMAIFFPLFTLLEDLGYLPRVAFNLDHLFKRACAHGKQCLTMCMGIGCNAAGIIGCRIIESPRERLIAILTNNFMPCNGRFPTLLAISSVFLVVGNNSRLSSAIPALTITIMVVLGVIITLIVSYILSKTLLKGVPSSFTLELPPYRKPQIGRILYTSIIDRTIFVLGRAVAIAAPAGVVIWILSNITIGNMSILCHIANFLEPLAKIMGLDGFILLAFILGIPANEIVVPILLMAYLSQGSMIDFENLESLKQILISHGWTYLTALNVMIFTLLHWPCATTLWTIKKETGSAKWTALAAIIPTCIAFAICILNTFVFKILGWV
ncbi:iron transporter FeoB [Clostridium sp. K25]|uniref:ferrous iron transport protein B n=1 Tax=Clostridium sp. K25 TaxID=1443109 RepID=UPI0004D491FA|nr:ferrous iron transport protein B [Clostridium sp. K25]KEI10276.1 iron transporter FeoB [Clostridium sp. K25]